MNLELKYLHRILTWAFRIFLDPFYVTRHKPLTPNDPYSDRTAPLTSKVAFYIFIQQV